MTTMDSAGVTAKSEEKNALRCIFFKLVVHKKLQITYEVLESILKTEVNVKVGKIPIKQQYTLPHMLVYYMTIWPGWEKQEEYLQGKLSLEEWYTKFRKYITHKMRKLMTETLEAVLKEIDETNEQEVFTIKKVDDYTEFGKSGVSDLCVKVFGPPSLLSTLVFKANEDDIVVEKHVEREWTKIDHKALFNWPYVAVEFLSSDLGFSRKSTPLVQRYISSNMGTQVASSEFIMSADICNSSIRRHCFSHSLISAYIDQYKETIKYLAIDDDEMREISLLLEQFLKDIMELNINQAIATNTSVKFNIGKNSFKRSKRVNDRDINSAVVYNEVFTPTVELLLFYFNGNEDILGNAVKPTFISLNNLLTNGYFDVTKIECFRPTIQYTCTFCHRKFLPPNAKHEIVEHLANTHKREQSLLCLWCNRSLEISSLASDRWVCQCKCLTSLSDLLIT